MKRRIVVGSILIASAMLATGLLAVGYIGATVRAEAQQELFRQAEVTGSLVESEIANVNIDGSPNLEARLRRFRGNIALILNRARVVGGHDIVEASLVVRDRTIPLSIGQVLTGQLPLDLEEQEALTLTVDGTAVLATVQRVEVGSAEIVVAIGRSAPLLPTQAMTRTLLITIGVGAALIVLLGLWMAERIVRRLSGLGDASRKIAVGDLSARAPADGDDEVAEASRAFNEMADALEARIHHDRSFLLNIGHDLRTPLTTIRGYAEALDEGTVEAGDAARVASILHTQTDRLSRLVEDIMLLARIEAREFTLRPETVDVAAVVEGVVEGFRPRAEDFGVALECASASPAQGWVDPDRLDQVCGNLIENALRYTPEGGTLTVEAEVESGNLQLTVSDTGPGIDPADFKRVFDRLFVTQRYRPLRPEGSGLGLTIVRELIEAMGGTVTVDSVPGAGTTFTVNLPVRSPQLKADG